VIEITPMTCHSIDRFERRCLAEQLARQVDARGFLRRTWVLFSLAVLGLGVWDFAIAQFHPLRMSVILVGGALSLLLLGMMFLHERADQTRQKQAERVKQDAESGACQKIRVTGIQAAWRRNDAHVSLPTYLLKSTGEERIVLISGPLLQDAIDEYYHQQLEAGLDAPLTMATELLVEQWTHSRKLKSVELSGPMLAGAPGEIPLAELAPALCDLEDELVLLTTLPEPLTRHLRDKTGRSSESKSQTPDATSNPSEDTVSGTETT